MSARRPLPRVYSAIAVAGLREPGRTAQDALPSLETPDPDRSWRLLDPPAGHLALVAVSARQYQDPAMDNPPVDNPLADPVLRSPSARRRGGLIRRSLRWLGRAIVLFIAITVILAALYRVVPPPLTPLMVIRLFEGNWISKDWVSYEEISPNLARAVIAAEDAGFCSHWGFDLAAIRKALRHNEKSRRLRGIRSATRPPRTPFWPGDTAVTCPRALRATSRS
jgi:hypothetical protein